MFEKVILRKLAEVILKRVTKRMTKKFDLDNVLKYVKEPNELDVQMKVQQKTSNKHGKAIEDLEKDNATMKSQIKMLLEWKSKESF